MLVVRQEQPDNRASPTPMSEAAKAAGLHDAGDAPGKKFVSGRGEIMQTWRACLEKKPLRKSSDSSGLQKWAGQLPKKRAGMVTGTSNSWTRDQMRRMRYRKMKESEGDDGEW